MSLSYTYDGDPLTHGIAPSGLLLPQRAEEGNAEFGALPIEDPDSTLTLVGHKAVTVEESACSQPRLWTGWTTSRDMGRSPENGLLVDDQRFLDTKIVDLNALFRFRHIRGAGGNRPEESWNDRLAWILGSDFLADLIEDTGYVMAAGGAWTCDATDYRGQYPAAVFDDLLQVSNTHPLNYFAFWDTYADVVGLYLGTDDGGIGDSALSISNVESDIDGIACFAPSQDTTLIRSPDQVFSEVTVIYRQGTKRLFRRRESTETAYTRRGTPYEVPRVYSEGRASIVAEAFLDRHAVEEDRITTTIIVPAESAGLVVAGQRINVRLSHLPGYDPAVSMRVVMSNPVPTSDMAAHYTIALELVAPKASGALPECPDPTPSNTFVPMNSGTSDADGNVMYLRPGLTYPEEPTPYFAGDWHYPQYGTTGSPDYAGDCVANRLRIAVVGPGSMLITTKKYTVGHTLDVNLYHYDAPETIVDDYQTVITDQACTVVVPADGFCNHWVDVTDQGDPCGDKWGWVSVVWTAGEVDEEEDLGNAPGALVNETPTPAPDGTTTTFTLANSYAPGSLIVYVDGIPIPSSEVTETDPAAGEFTLSWAPDADEAIRVVYLTG